MKWRLAGRATDDQMKKWGNRLFGDEPLPSLHLAQDIYTALQHERAQSRRRTMYGDWPHTTPSGHEYPHPTTFEQVAVFFRDRQLADIESWADDECPPEPTWHMVGYAIGEANRLRDLLAATEKKIDDALDLQPMPGSLTACIKQMRKILKA